MVTNLKMKAARLLAAAVVVAGMAGSAWAVETRMGRVQAHASERWEVWGTAGETITVAIKGVGDTKLDLSVYDDEGNFITAGDDRAGVRVVQFVVTRSSYFTISVRNLGDARSKYAISIATY